MPRKCTRLPASAITPAINHAAVHIDGTGIYISSMTSGLVERFSHDYKLLAQYTYPDLTSPIGIHTTSKYGLLACSTSAIYMLTDGSKLYHLTSGDAIEFIWHPVRETYMMVRTNGLAAEIDQGFREINLMICGVGQPNRVVPSNYSRNIYSLNYSYLNIAEHPMPSQWISSGAQWRKLFMRPTYSDNLVLLNSHSVALLDMWRSSTSGMQTYQFTNNQIDYMSHSVHINSNICVINAGGTMYVVDYRCGVARTIKVNLSITGPWYVESVNRMYVTSWHGDQTYAIDV